LLSSISCSFGSGGKEIKGAEPRQRDGNEDDGGNKRSTVSARLKLSFYHFVYFFFSWEK